MREDLHTELKREWKDEYLRNVAALANTEGGTIYVGVDDQGDIYGVDRVDHYLKVIPDKIQNVLGIVAIVDNHVKDGKDYLTMYKNCQGPLLCFDQYDSHSVFKQVMAASRQQGFTLETSKRKRRKHPRS